MPLDVMSSGPSAEQASRALREAVELYLDTAAEIHALIVIPTYDEIPIAVIRSNLKTAGISRDEYFRLLDQIH
jgi:hypothetical protein